MNELEIVRHRQIEGLTVFLDTVDYRTPHVHLEWELILLLDQPLAVTCEQQKFVLSPGQLLLVSPNEAHEFHKIHEGATFLCLQLSPAILPPMPHLSLEENILSQKAADQIALRKRLFAIAECYFRREENYELYCVGESLLVLYQLLKNLHYHILSEEEANNISRRNARLKRLIQFVDDNYMHKIRLADFAASEGCSLSYLSRFIKDTMNQTFQEYVTYVRFNCARKLISAGGMKMLDICMESGFSDYRYFSRAFRKQFHMTPEQYSQYKSKEKLETAQVCHSLHSAETFYSRENSLRILEKYAV